MNTVPATKYFCSSLLPQELLYVSRDSSCVLEAEVIDDKIIILKFSGVLEEKDQTASDILIQGIFELYESAGLPTSFFVIADVSDLNWVNVSARKASQLSVARFFAKGYVEYLLIVSPNYMIRTLFNLLGRFEKRVLFTTCKSQEEAFEYIGQYRQENQLAKIPKQRIEPEKFLQLKRTLPPSAPSGRKWSLNPIRKIWPFKNGPGRSKEQAKNLQIKFLKEEIENLKLHQQKRIDQLFRTMSSITWDENFTPGNFDERTDNDPFCILMDAAEMLQRDVKDMIRESREHNNMLEGQISERTREIALKEANLSALVENTPDMILSASHDYKILISNSSLRKMSKKILGFPLEPGMNLKKVLSPEIINYWEHRVARVLEGDTFKTIENLNIRGKEYYFEYSFNPIAEADGYISGFSFFARDITRRQLIEEKARSQQQLLSSINKSIREGIFRSTPNNGILYVNEAFAEMFGYDSVEEVLLLDAGVLYVNPARRQDFRNMMQENTYFTNEEAEFKRKDGTVFWGLMSSIKTVDEKGQVFFDGAIRDVTKMREDERKIKEQNQKLIKVNRELDKFVYSVSHDLRAPLVSVKGLIDISRLETCDENRSHYYDLMDRSINKLDNFIRDIMGYSRNVRAQLVSQKIDFEPLIKDVLEVLQFAPGNEKIEKTVKIDISGEFYSDPMRLKMIFNNIISNGFRYSDLSKSHPFVAIDITGNENRVTIKIEDNGIGIASESKDKIFDMFYRGTKNSQGSGIGLYIVSEALEKLGGTISVESVFGEGTCFTIELPSIPKNLF
ncbi:MAG: PAS domain S-box protein [Bacteroidia bacterium]|nr:PAS domain S-box protein [Bacteroidia bacterium]